jgi:hypothetical protein
VNRTVFLVCVVLAGVAGFLAGRASVEGAKARGDARPDYAGGRTERRLVEMPADEVAVLRRKARELDERVRRELETGARPVEDAGSGPEVDAGSDALPVGARRRDGTIVGGASWSPMTRNMALGFLDPMIEEFFAEANLTADQKQRLKAEIEARIGKGMQAAADFVNGDANGDQAYEQLKTMLDEGRRLVQTVLDDEQLKTYRKFEGRVISMVHTNVVNNELATLRAKLDLDPEQATAVRAIVETRYRRVQDKFDAAIPNMFFKPIRREADAEIYAETAGEIRKFLRPEQATAFDAYEATANDALHEFRNMLVPKAR